MPIIKNKKQLQIVLKDILYRTLKVSNEWFRFKINRFINRNDDFSSVRYFILTSFLKKAT